MNARLERRISELEAKQSTPSEFFHAWAQWGVPYIEAVARGDADVHEAVATIRRNLPDKRGDLLIEFCDGQLATRVSRS